MLNKRNFIGINKTRFMNSDFSSNGDLIIESFPYSNAITIRFLYIKKFNGRTLFYDEEKNEFAYHILKNMNLLIKINLIRNNEKDYFISHSFFNYSINIDNKKILIFLKGNFLGFQIGLLNILVV